MLSRRKLFGFLAAAPVAGAAAAKALAKEPEAPVRVVKHPDPTVYRIRCDKFLINLKEGRMEIYD